MIRVGHSENLGRITTIGIARSGAYITSVLTITTLHRPLSTIFAMLSLQYLLASFATLSFVSGAVVLQREDNSSLTSAAAEPEPTVPYASTEPNSVLWGPDSPPSVPKPFRGTTGASILGPDNIPLDLENPDLLAPPSTDNGEISNSKWPFSFSPMRLQTGGWARQQNTRSFPVSTSMAAVDMMLEPGAIRELHWHSTAEWAYVLKVNSFELAYRVMVNYQLAFGKGTTQVTAVDQDGRNFLATVRAGDLWYFPPGIPHSLQATNDSAEGSEFLLVFPDGDFSDDGTFLLTDWLAHVPAEVIRKNFGVANPAAFSRIPDRQLYIFPSEPPSDDASDVSDSLGTVPQPFFFPFSNTTATQLEGGSVKVVDSTTFKISEKIAAVEVMVNPGGMREMHWHPTQDEWTFVLEGEARITIFAANSNAKTFNFQPGDIGFIPASYGHYVENTGNGTLRYLEVFNTDRYQDVSLNQWLALTPPALVKAHLGLDDATIGKLKKTKPTVVGPIPPQ
ncbi:hypothetical protein D9757_008456 [Collybiopsis confluens]|uniref:Cupin type-1 domain-containing protein n=1 Tax=Collybiopsis confluens TaxID=2823264 RepID=A0A8H5HFC2_9AGAR|nr:hypothetical protein D9757_008456 [Collybiopsis confluens]